MCLLDSFQRSGLTQKAGERHRVAICSRYSNSGILLHVKWSNFWTIEYNFATCLPMLGHDLEMSCTKFHENRLIIDGEIDEKHALQTVVSKTIVN